MTSYPIVLSIAGSDNTGGAGIQSDIKTCCAYGVYAATVITGVTAQNSKGVYGVEPVSLEILRLQIDSIFEVMRPDAIKTGMLPSPEIISVVAEKIREYDVKKVVVDPVMVATNGGSLVKPGEETLREFKRSLLPLATVVTPNLSEASTFLLEDISSSDPAETCQRLINIFLSHSVLLKGGHSSQDLSIDYLYDGKNLKEYKEKKIKTLNTHGTGCTLSTAIACGLAKGWDIEKAVRKAKRFITKAIRNGSELEIKNGPCPLDFIA